MRIVIVGAGHAGLEAANILSKIGANVILITNEINSICKMNCNPSIGGIGKSQMVKEIDSLGGLMGFIADISGTYFKTLNTSKGIAVQSLRIQVDKLKYSKIASNIIINSKNVKILQGIVEKILIKNNKVKGVFFKNILIKCNSILLACGTSLNSKVYLGRSKKTILKSSLSDQINYIFGNAGKRFKTGTPPRIDEKSINYSKLKKQKSENPIPFFSYRSIDNKYKYIYKNRKLFKCYYTHTNIKTCEIIMNNLDKSSLYSGLIKSKGPRYCPCIEDKVIKFKKNKKHIIFLEKESLFSNKIYPSGISNSLPINEQIKFIRSIKGLENAKIIKPGYAIEYDYFDPKQLKNNLESKYISGLFMAGQINGTTGYEEAASQGIIAGINSFKKINFDRKTSYLGVLIDDIIKGVDEPYRMFTSKSEYRLQNRQDNSDIRMLNISKNIKSLRKSIIDRFKKKKKYIKKSEKKINIILKKSNILLLKKILKINKFKFKKEIFSKILYKKYIEREKRKIDKFNINLNLNISKFKFENIKNLSKEILEKIIKKKKNIKKLKDLLKIKNISKVNLLDIHNYLLKFTY
ncbi:tRNA uridine-5-carboxymethylaminomethyl(34) synthesis enzyme MnmG [Candidatus Vidania fulgoroideorum]